MNRLNYLWTQANFILYSHNPAIQSAWNFRFIYALNPNMYQDTY